MSGRIFTAYHFTPQLVSGYRADDLYSPVVMENYTPSPGVLAGELPPDDRRFDAYESMKWHVWKNLAAQYDWVGFQQYRRTLDFGGRSNDEIRAFVEPYDIITHQPTPWGGMEHMRKQFRDNHSHTHWDAFERVMGPGWDFDVTLIPHGAIGTMRTDVLMPYMARWNEVVAEVSTIIGPLTDKDPMKQRTFGFLAERFFTLYFYRLLKDSPKLKFLFIPIVQGLKLR